jgi:hypothetical protein
VTDRPDIPKRRFLAAALLLLQLSVAGFVPLADAALEAAASDGSAHIESQDGEPCPPGHDHDVCEFCRVAGHDLVYASALNVAAAPTAWTPSRAPTTPRSVRTARLGGPFGPRAPPLV